MKGDIGIYLRKEADIIDQKKVTVRVVTNQNIWGRAKDSADWLLIFTDCFCQKIRIISVSYTIRKITAQAVKIAAFINRGSDFSTYHVTILMLFI